MNRWKAAIKALLVRSVTASMWNALVFRQTNIANHAFPIIGVRPVEPVIQIGPA